MKTTPVNRDEAAESTFIYNYMKDLRDKVHNRIASNGLNREFRVLMVVTLRQVLS